jgi:hypothetical protein
MGALRDRMDNGNVVWLDSLDYAASLLARGLVPWLDVAEFISLQRRAQSLLKSDVVMLALAPACAAWLVAHADVQAAMRVKTRTLFPLKTLLAYEALRKHLVELAIGMRASLAGLPLALVLPSPRAWVAIAYGQAHPDQSIEVLSDDAESAGVYVADFLRSFGSCGIDALLLEQTRDLAPIQADDIACYQSVLNVARNYRWDVGLRTADPTDPTLAAHFDYTIATQAISSPLNGIDLHQDFWTGASPALPAAVPLRYAAIPARSQPEAVLERLASLR